MGFITISRDVDGGSAIYSDGEFISYHPQIDYEVGDTITSKSGGKTGVCTGFTHNDTCVLIDGICYGGKEFFQKVYSLSSVK